MTRRAFFLLPLAAALALSQPPARAPLALPVPFEDKSFFVLTLIERSPSARAAVEADSALAAIASAKRAALARIASECTQTPCFTAAMKWTEEEIDAADKSLRALYRAGGAIRALAGGPLRESGMYERHRARGGEELLAQAWREAARRANLMIEVFAEGKPPSYPAIDSPLYDLNAPLFPRLLASIAAALDDAEPTLFFAPSTRFALMLMDAHHRDESARYEPLHLGENASALARVPSIAWDAFPYTVIIVPGAGGQRIDVPLSPGGKLRCMLAAKRFKQGMAPFILVSGGHVHPNRTPFAEAIEMKRSLIRDFGVPANAVFVDPHARHTTTNLRNAVRQIYRYGIPFERKALITTDQSQSAYIESEIFRVRCDKELGYQPHLLHKRLSRFDLEMTGRLDSLHIDPLELLDP